MLATMSSAMQASLKTVEALSSELILASGCKEASPRHAARNLVSWLPAFGLGSAQVRSCLAPPPTFAPIHLTLQHRPPALHPSSRMRQPGLTHQGLRAKRVLFPNCQRTEIELRIPSSRLSVLFRRCSEVSNLASSSDSLQNNPKFLPTT